MISKAISFPLKIQNPAIVDSVGEIICGDTAMECTGEVIFRTEAAKKLESIPEMAKNIA